MAWIESKFWNDLNTVQIYFITFCANKIVDTDIMFGLNNQSLLTMRPDTSDIFEPL